VGDSRHSFYLAPEALGGLPIECDMEGNALTDGDGMRYVERFKDDEGRVRRQGARFGVFAYDDAHPDGVEVTLDDAEVEAIEWTVHLANKKPVWFQGSQLVGNLMFGRENSYEAKGVPLRNADVPADQRQAKLITDPGPRSLSQPGRRVELSRENVPHDYPFGSFPDPDLGPYSIDSLGTLVTDASGRLVVLGGYGRACGQDLIATFTGADSWYDDISDGPVYCTLRLRSGETVELQAWALVGPPKFAPELRNISTLDDVMYDVAVRYMGLEPELFDRDRWPDTHGWNPDYEASFEDDIAPIMERPADYVWVANVPSMIAFSYPRFDVRDASEENRHQRERYLHYFRDPGKDETSPGHQLVVSPEGVPLMPLNAGSNPVTNELIDKFASLTQTQYALLRQWARGRFTVGQPSRPLPGIHQLDRASVGNCAGHPMSPGWEVTWSTRNPAIYGTPYVIRHRYGEDHYRAHGLSTGNDETDPEAPDPGSEPGDLTKRMSSPWQSDFYQCSIEYISFEDPTFNQDEVTQIPPPPTYYAYWWPPQAPMHVMSGDMTAAEQQASGTVAGYQVVFPRGANNIARLVVAWRYMGFILNQNTADDRARYPYFVERERNHDRFVAGSVSVGQPINQLAASGSYFTEDNYFFPFWYLRDEEHESAQRRRT
jgi:L-lysine 6-oxidase